MNEQALQGAAGNSASELQPDPVGISYWQKRQIAYLRLAMEYWIAMKGIFAELRSGSLSMHALNVKANGVIFFIHP